MRVQSFRSSISPARSLALLVLMKLANQFVTFNYALFNSNIYEMVNGSSSSWKATTLQCRMKSSYEMDRAPDDPMKAYMFRYVYTLSAIGGILSSATRNRRLVLTIGGCTMTVSALAVFLVRALGLACNRVAYVLAWLPYPVFMVMVLAPLLAAFADCRLPSFGPQGGRTFAIVMYYVASSSTIWFNMWVWKLADIFRYNHSHELIGVVAVVLSITFVFATRLISPSAAGAPTARRRFELPTMRRLLRYFLILTAFTLFLVNLKDDHIVEYQNEAKLYMKANATDQFNRDVRRVFDEWNVPRMVNMASMLLASTLIAVHSGSNMLRSSTLLRLTFQTRLLSGIALGAIVAAFCLACDLTFKAYSANPLPSLVPALAFSLAGFVDGWVEILAMVAVYELVFSIATETHRDLLVGISLSLWSTASVLRQLLHSGLLPLIVPQESSYKGHTRYCATHIIDIVLCIVSLAYTRLVSLRLAAPIMLDEDGGAADSEEERAEEDSADEEMRSLIPDARLR